MLAAKGLTRSSSNLYKKVLYIAYYIYISCWSHQFMIHINLTMHSVFFVQTRIMTNIQSEGSLHLNYCFHEHKYFILGLFRPFLSFHSFICLSATLTPTLVLLVSCCWLHLSEISSLFSLWGFLFLWCGFKLSGLFLLTAPSLSSSIRQQKQLSTENASLTLQLVKDKSSVFLQWKPSHVH